jgi:hypothetical protein
MSSDVAGPVQVDHKRPDQPRHPDQPKHPDQPSLPAAVAVGAVICALVAGGAVLAVGPLLSRPDQERVTLTGRGSTEAAGSWTSDRTTDVYLLVRNDSGRRLRIESVRTGAARVRPGTAGPACRPDAVSVLVDTAGLDVGPGQSALFTARLTLAAGSAFPCRDAVFDLPVTALARPA